MPDLTRQRYFSPKNAAQPESSAWRNGVSSRPLPDDMSRPAPMPENPVIASLRKLRLDKQAAPASSQLKPHAHDLPPNAFILDRFRNGLAGSEEVCRVTTAIIRKKNLAPIVAYGCLKALKDAGVAPNSFIYNALIANCGRNGQVDLAFAVFKEMHISGFAPSIFIFNALISACGKTGNTDRALAVFADMYRHGVAPDQVTYSALISSCGKTGNADQALALFADMQRHGIAPDLITFNALISACEKSGQVTEALNVFADMRRHGVAADLFTFNTLILACNRGNLPQIMQIPYLLAAMVATGVLYPSLGYTAHDETLDFHARRLLVTPGQYTGDSGSNINTAVAKAIFYYHAAKGHLSENTKFVVGQHGDNAIKSMISCCIRDQGWIPKYEVTPAGRLNCGCLQAQVPRSFIINTNDHVPSFS